MNFGLIEKDAEARIEEFRDKWSRGKLSLLASHVIFAIDETREIMGWIETDDMDEAEKMFLELIVDLRRCIPVKKEKLDIEKILKEIGQHHDS